MEMTTVTSPVDSSTLDTGALKRFAQEARRLLRDQVSSKLARVLAEHSAARREAPKAVRELETEIVSTSRDQIIERVAYTWFNRFTALRFMDVNGYTGVRVVTPADDQTRPEVLSEAMAGVLGEEVPESIATQVRMLLDNRAPSPNPQGEAYRLLLVATCNYWHAAMPFMFEKIADYTELLMPEDLLSQGSILAKMRTVMTEDACRDVEVIGWLYQFYISEKKDEVFAGLKKNIKISAENIPAATQLFTPHWIVRYLVENSLGRVWMLNKPNSRLKERMDYYIAPEEPDTDFLRISSPEEIKVCDPACGSGHMLTYAFDLLHAIYEEEGYDAAEIPGLILANNLYGIEIDERAGALAAFALMMKAAARRKRFLRRGKEGVPPHVCVLENVGFTDHEITEYSKEIGHDLSTPSLRETLGQFRNAKNFGSLIVPTIKDVTELRRMIASKDTGGDMLFGDVHQRIQTLLRMVEFLSPRYHVVIANPPYMGGKGMNTKLADFLRKQFPDEKSDLFSAFIKRNAKLAVEKASLGYMTPFVWMFLKTFESLRSFLLSDQSIGSLIRPEYHAFFESAFVPICAFTLTNSPRNNSKAVFIDLTEFYGAEIQPIRAREAIQNKTGCRWRYVTNLSDLSKIPGSPIAYWLSQKVFDAFSKLPALSTIAPTKQGLATGENDRFLRLWHEPSLNSVAFDCDSSEGTLLREERWYPCNKGGQFRKWFGNNEFLVNWQCGGAEIKGHVDENGRLRSRPQNESYYFRSGLTWSTISSSSLSMRLSPKGAMFETKGAMCFPDDLDMMPALAFANSKVVNRLLLALAPTLDFHEGPVGRLPYSHSESSRSTAAACVDIARNDWDAYETSWSFTTLPLLDPTHRAETLNESYACLRAHWRDVMEEMVRLEKENNRIFIDLYGLRDELTSDVPLDEITLTCNPAYRYGGKKSGTELEALLVADTMREFVSYAVGCMFGRYSLDAPGLILASTGQGLKDYLAKIPVPTFEPDADNVIPVLDGDWFSDDIAARFRRFLRVTFGEEHFPENLTFVEEALGKDIRKYFARDFFSDHLRRYKKRPIYWMFSSPKGTFNALIYMHRYRPDTVSVVLNEYLREFRSKLESYRRAQEALSISSDASSAQKTKALKEIEATAKQIDEIGLWERDVVFPLATQKIEIDLHDGVKVNYQKFGSALKPIKGLNDSDD